MADGGDMRTQLAALEGLVGSAGWAHMLALLAEWVDQARATCENPRAEVLERTIAAARIQCLRGVVEVPGETIEVLRKQLNIGGE